MLHIYVRFPFLAINNLAFATANDEYVIHLFLQHVEELLEYVRFGLWWVALGVASSIGLGEFNQ